MDNHQIVLNRSIIVRGLAAIAALLVLASIGGQLIKYLTGHDGVYGLIRLFDLDEENNIPTFFSTSLLLIADLLLWIITIVKRTSRAPYAFGWTILALIFLCLAVDEAASIHELLDRPVKELLGNRASGIFYYSWVIPSMAFTLFLGLFLSKFMLHLPTQTLSFFVLAAVLYIGGAIGVELIGGRYDEQHGFQNLPYAMIVTIEEALEMAGLIVFIYALMTYIEASCGEVQFRFKHSTARERF